MQPRAMTGGHGTPTCVNLLLHVHQQQHMSWPRPVCSSPPPPLYSHPPIHPAVRQDFVPTAPLLPNPQQPPPYLLPPPPSPPVYNSSRDTRSVMAPTCVQLPYSHTPRPQRACRTAPSTPSPAVMMQNFVPTSPVVQNTQQPLPPTPPKSNPAPPVYSSSRVTSRGSSVSGARGRFLRLAGGRAALLSGDKWMVRRKALNIPAICWGRQGRGGTGNRGCWGVGRRGRGPRVCASGSGSVHVKESWTASS